ncbi:Ff.00g022440.m01.CDS01 [Fusarium sp. VM40]|nr:Ff.00g022440.m01.CDS01 [Fusarium sp. VM40]
MSRSDGSTSDHFYVPRWYLAYPPRSYDEHNSPPDGAEPPSGNYVRYASIPYFDLAEDAFQYLPRYSNVASNYYMMESSYATGEPVRTENRPFLDLVPPPNTPVRSSFDDEDYSPAPCNFDFGGTENSHLFDYTEDEYMEDMEDMEDMQDMEDEDDEDMEDEDDEDEDERDMPDPFRPLFETAEIATLFDETDIDDEEELEWEIFDPQTSIGDLPSEYDEPHPESY